MPNDIAKIEVFDLPKGLVNLDSVSTTLMEMMKEVRQNPSVIPQAQCMAEIAGRVIDIAKVQVQQGNMLTDLLRTKNGI